MTRVHRQKSQTQEVNHKKNAESSFVYDENKADEIDLVSIFKHHINEHMQYVVPNGQ